MKGISRQIDELGRIVIPKEMRLALEIDAKDELDMTLNADTIVLRKVNKSCVFCGSELNLVSFGEKCICGKCAKKLKEELK